MSRALSEGELADLAERYGFAVGRLRGLVERVERLHEERKARGEDISAVYKEAKAAGFDVAALKMCIRRRQHPKAENELRDNTVDTYERALDDSGIGPAGSAGETE